MQKTTLLFGWLIVMATAAAAQTTPSPTRSPLATPAGHEINVSLQHYEYVEPDPVDISIFGPKAGAEYTGTWLFSQQRHWFGRFNARASGGAADYDGWCRPWQIAPSATSSNGYALKLGDRSKCTESKDADWYAEGRAIIGKDLVADAWSLSPFAGVGVRHLANGVTGNANFRTEEYLYVPVGATLRAAVGSSRAIEFTVEYDHLIRGWQKTRNSLLGGGTVPATATAPSFTIGDFTDLSFAQHRGHAFRADATVPVASRWFIAPYFTYWRVSDSPVSTGSVAYTVKGITVLGALNAYEPLNTTTEAGVKIGFRFGQK